MNQDYKQLLSEVIKKQIVILGPDITLAKARNVPGLVVADDGTVTDISGDQQQISQKLIDQFVQLSGEIVRKTMEPLLTINSPQPTPAVQAQTVQAPPPSVEMPTTLSDPAPAPAQPEPALPDASTAQQAINASITSPASSTPQLNAMPTPPTPTVIPINQQPLAQDEKNVQ